MSKGYKMEWKRLLFSGHAIRRMFQRSIRVDQVRHAIEAGEIRAEYSSDRPYPSCLMLGFVGDQPLHVVASFDRSNQECHVITVCVPDPAQWGPDHRTRRVE